MKAVVLVGGEGTRLRPLTYDRPKQMLPLVGKPMIERVVDHLGSHGIDEVILSLGYLPDAFLRAYPDGVVGGVKLAYAVEPEPYDTAGAVRFATEETGVDGTFVVLNGDVLTDLDLSSLVAFHRRQGALATIHLHPVEDPSRFGVVVTDEEGRVGAFIEKPPRDEAPTNLVNAGTYVLERSAIERVPLGRRVSIERETFPGLAREGVLYAFADDGYWLDTGTPDAYLQAHSDLLARGAPTGTARQTAPGVFTEPTVTLAGQASGPSYLAEGVYVGAGATVERSVLGPGCRVEEGAVVADSVLLDEVSVARGSTVSGSILGDRVSVGERCQVSALSILGTGVIVPSGTELESARRPESAPGVV